MYESKYLKKIEDKINNEIRLKSYLEEREKLEKDIKLYYQNMPVTAVISKNIIRRTNDGGY